MTLSDKKAGLKMAAVAIVLAVAGGAVIHKLVTKTEQKRTAPSTDPSEQILEQIRRQYETLVATVTNYQMNYVCRVSGNESLIPKYRGTPSEDIVRQKWLEERQLVVAGPRYRERAVRFEYYDDEPREKGTEVRTFDGERSYCHSPKEHRLAVSVGESRSVLSRDPWNRYKLPLQLLATYPQRIESVGPFSEGPRGRELIEVRLHLEKDESVSGNRGIYMVVNPRRGPCVLRCDEWLDTAGVGLCQRRMVFGDHRSVEIGGAEFRLPRRITVEGPFVGQVAALEARDLEVTSFSPRLTTEPVFTIKPPVGTRVLNRDLGTEHATAPEPLPPHRGVILDLDRPFRPASWNVRHRLAQVFFMDRSKGHPRFVVGEPGKARSWVYYLDLPVSLSRYPVLVLRYRAENLSHAGNPLVMWVDDGSGPNGAGGGVWRYDQIFADGRVHELREDLRYIRWTREDSPRESITGMCFYTYAAPYEGPAVFELLDLRFEAEEVASPSEAWPDDEPLTVEVVDGKGHPVAGALVVADRERKNYARCAATDEEGRATVTPLQNDAANHTLYLDAEGFVPLTLRRVSANGTIRVTLNPGKHLGGRVINEGGEPVAGAAVTGRLPGAGRDRSRRGRYRFTVLTDADGRWQSPLMPVGTGRMTLRLAHPDYVSDSRGTAMSHPMAELVAGTAVAVLDRGITLDGLVLDPHGDPARGAWVKPGRERRSASYGRSRTDKAGRFQLTNLKPGELILTVEATGFAPQLKRVTAQAGMEPVTFNLTPGQTIWGRVVDSDGAPIPDATVSADTWRGVRSLSWSAKTDREGQFEWMHAPEDEVLCSVYKRGYMRVRRFAIKPADAEVVVTLPNPLEISGKVTDAETGNPVETFTIIPGTRWKGRAGAHWDQRGRKTFTHGAYKLEFIHPQARRVLRVEADGYLPAVSRPFNSDEGVQRVDFGLREGKGLTGFVRDPHGKAVAGAQLVLGLPGQYVSVQNGQVDAHGSLLLTTGPQGQYRLPPQVDPCTLVVVHERGYVEVDLSRVGKSGDITLAPWARVEGEFRIGVRPGSNERMRILKDRSSTQAAYVHHELLATTDAQGQFVFGRVPPGSASLVRCVQLADDAWGSAGRKPLDIEAGETRRVKLGGTGRPVAGRLSVPEAHRDTVDWGHARCSMRSRLLRPETTYPGNWESMSEEARRNWAQQWRESDEGRAFIKKLEAAKRNQASYMFRVKADGGFRVEDVPAGKYTLSCSVYDRAAGGRSRYGRCIGTLEHGFEVPAMPGGRLDAPLALGTLEVVMQPR